MKQKNSALFVIYKIHVTFILLLFLNYLGLKKKKKKKQGLAWWSSG